MRFFLSILLSLLLCGLLFSCNGEQKQIAATTAPLSYMNFDTSSAASKNVVYVPVYSHAFMFNEERPANMAATLSIRSTAPADSMYLGRVDYYSYKGELLKSYISKTVLLKPMNAVAFVVDELDTKGGVGAYFLVHWFAQRPVNEPVVQAVMLSTVHNMGYSFVTDGVKLPR